MAAYTAQLQSPELPASPFIALTLETLLAQLDQAGGAAIAGSITARYLDFTPAYALLDQHLDGPA